MLIDSPALRSSPDPSPDRVSAVSPYPGLRPFSEHDSRLFFGREAETATLLQILEIQQLVVVHGASGCGKSSLVRAGLIPVFRMDAAANSKRGVVVIVRPADEGGPLASLARKLDVEIELTPSADGEEELDGRSWSTVLTTSPDWAKDIGERVDAAGGALCIVFDQFEEVFAANKSGYAAQVQRVIDFLNSLTEPSPEGTALGGRPLSVVVTMRSDYLGNCATWEGFAETVNRCQYLLPRLSAVGLLRAIYEPARLSGGEVDSQVAERLLTVVKSELDGLPIVQHALSRAWYCSTLTRGSRIINMAAMEAVGGADNALSDHADQVLAAATAGTKKSREPDPDLTNVADWMLRSLSDLDTDARIIRRSITFEQLEREVGAKRAKLEAVLLPFRAPENSLIMPPSTDELHDKTVISISHEALLRQWKHISETGFEDQRAIGLVYREAQDGMIWRALSVQGQQFAKDHESILGPAATEQRRPWYREVAERPGWIARHEMKAWLSTEEEVQLHWQQVADLMEASEANLQVEQQKLQRERELVGDLKQSQTKLLQSQKVQKRLTWAIGGLLGLLIVALSTSWTLQVQGLNIQLKSKDDQKQRAIAQVEAQWAAAEKEKNARSELFALRSAFFVAERYCSGKALTGKQLQSCLEDQTERYKDQIKTTAIEQQVNYAQLPNSPLGGGFARAPTAKGGPR